MHAATCICNSDDSSSAARSAAVVSAHIVCFCSIVSCWEALPFGWNIGFKLKTSLVQGTIGPMNSSLHALPCRSQLYVLSVQDFAQLAWALSQLWHHPLPPPWLHELTETAHLKLQDQWGEGGYVDVKSPCYLIQVWQGWRMITQGVGCRCSSVRTAQHSSFMGCETVC